MSVCRPLFSESEAQGSSKLEDLVAGGSGCWRIGLLEDLVAGGSGCWRIWLLEDGVAGGWGCCKADMPSCKQICRHVSRFADLRIIIVIIVIIII